MRKKFGDAWFDKSQECAPVVKIAPGAKSWDLYLLCRIIHTYPDVICSDPVDEFKVSNKELLLQRTESVEVLRHWKSYAQ